MKFITLFIACILVCELSQSQTLVLKDSANKIIASYSPRSRIKKQQLIEAKTILFFYEDSSKLMFDFYLTTHVSDPFFYTTGYYGNILGFDFGYHLGKLTLKKEAEMIFDVISSRSESGFKRISKGFVFFMIE